MHCKVNFIVQQAQKRLIKTSPFTILQSALLVLCTGLAFNFGIRNTLIQLANMTYADSDVPDKPAHPQSLD